jgi:phospholipid/cholesterol/gamma-HCH transport system substrate-binding protein
VCPARKERAQRQEDPGLNNKNFAVGLFVALALAVFVSATIWLTGRQGSEPTTSYSMYFEKDVGGLMLGGPVFYLGVEVGTVIAMTIIPGNPMQVRVDARVLTSAPVDQGTYASLAFQGITGVAVIKLNADPGVHESLQIRAGQQNPVIVVRDSGFSALLAKAPNVVDKLDSILEQIHQILGPENRDFVSTVLGDLSKVSSALASQEEAISKIPETLQQTIEELHSNLIQIKSLVVKLEPDLSTSLANLDQVTRNLVDMTERLDDWTAGNDADMNSFMEDGLGQVPALVADARSTLREVEKLVKDLREDPSALVYKPNEDDIDVEK